MSKTHWRFINLGSVRPVSVVSRWSGETIESDSFHGLLKKFMSHHADKGIFLPKDWERDFHTDFCEQNHLEGIDCEKDLEGKQYPGPGDLLRFAQTFLGWIVKGGLKAVLRGESERRAAICAACPENVEMVHGCFGCTTLGPPIAEATRLLGNMKTTLDDKLNYCAACGCVLKLKVHTPEEFLKDDHVTYPENCWRYRGN